jgi:hypothetical protein
MRLPALVAVLVVMACTKDVPAPPGPTTDAPSVAADANAVVSLDAALSDAAPALADASPPTPRPRAAPAAPRVDPLFACRADRDCTLLWLGRGCVRSDPKAVALAKLGEAQKTFSKGPPHACGIGGPDHEKRVRAVEMRYGVTCQAGVCTLVDRGEQNPVP